MATSEIKTSDHIEKLKALSRRVAQMEDIIEGVAGILKAIDSGGLLARLPDDGFADEHTAATAMLNMLNVTLKNFDARWRDLETVSCELSDLAAAIDRGSREERA